MRAKSWRVVEGPVKIDGGVSRLIEFSDGSGRVETWGPDGWRKGGASISELLSAPDAKPEFLAKVGVRSDERSPD
jgi:hypothetical protein